MKISYLQIKLNPSFIFALILHILHIIFYFVIPTKNLIFEFILQMLKYMKHAVRCFFYSQAKCLVYTLRTSGVPSEKIFILNEIEQTLSQCQWKRTFCFPRCHLSGSQYSCAGQKFFSTIIFTDYEILDNWLH